MRIWTIAGQLTVLGLCCFLDQACLPTFALTTEAEAKYRITAATGPYFFCDPRVLEDYWGVERFVVPLHRHGDKPLLVTTDPWEGSGPHAGGTVLYDPADRLFRMWYSVFNADAYYGKLPFSYNVCYAESTDGYEWKKPNLGVFDLNGSTANNCIKLGTDKTQNIDVMLNPLPDQYPGKFLSIHNQKGGVFISSSTDGYTFHRLVEEPAISYHSDTHNNFVYDESRDRWLMFCRPRAWAGDHRRRVSLKVSSNLENWSHERTILIPTETEKPEYYGLKVFRRGDLFFGTIQIYDRKTALMHEELIWSEDGEHWVFHPEHPEFASRGPEGSWDAGMVIVVESPVEVGDELRFYYGGFAFPHDVRENPCGMGLMTAERDRLVGFRPNGEEPGRLITRPFNPDGKNLRLNATLNGPLRAELRTDGNKAIEGFSLGDSDPVTGEGFNLPVTWKGRELHEAGVDEVRVLMEFADGEVFAFGLH